MPDDTARNDFESLLKPLWLRAQSGDEKAYRQALLCIAPRLRGYLRRRMQNLPDHVEDLVQEILLALHLHRDTYDRELAVSAWVHAIARHKLVDFWRRHGRHEGRHDPFNDMDDASMPVAAPSHAEAQRDLEKLLQRLPEAQRRAIQLTKIEGLSVAEASRQTGASASAVKVQVHRGMKRLAALVRRES
jgi:RNA polymerase sigma-70 factor, ECF subfamily